MTNKGVKCKYISIFLQSSLAHNINITSRHFKSPATWLFVQQLFRPTIKKPSKLCIIGPLWGESTSTWWIPLTKCQWYSKRLHIMTSQCTELPFLPFPWWSCRAEQWGGCHVWSPHWSNPQSRLVTDADFVPSPWLGYLPRVRVRARLPCTCLEENQKVQGGWRSSGRHRRSSGWNHQIGHVWNKEEEILWHIEAETKWTPFSRRHFQMDILEWKCMNFD